MRYPVSVLVVTLAAFSTAHAAPAKTSPFSNKSFGDGGGYKHPDSTVGQFLETKPQIPADEPSPRPAPPAKVSPEPRPAREAASRPRPRPFAPIVVEKKHESTPAPERRAIPSGAEEGAHDSASEDARRDYEARLFGAESEPRRPLLEETREPSSYEAPSSEAASPAPSGEGLLFVSLELEPQEASALRDAVAGLGSAAAFRPDARFQPLPIAGGSVRISGWLPAARLGDAIARPGVRRVEVERGSRPAPDTRVRGSYVLKLRVTDATRPEESIAASVQELTSGAGFTLGRVIGVEKTPVGGSVALVSGSMPVSQLSRVLGFSGVIGVASDLPVEAPVSDAPAAPAPKGGFLQFVMARSLWLVLLTALLALPTVAEVVKKGLSVFVPYR